jgi:hypothetical protein
MKSQVIFIDIDFIAWQHRGGDRFAIKLATTSRA